MKNHGRSTTLAIAFILVAAVLAALPAMAQEITGELGWPGATAATSGRQLPPPDPKFGGVVKDDAVYAAGIAF